MTASRLRSRSRRVCAAVAVDLRHDALVAVQLRGLESPARVAVTELPAGPAASAGPHDRERLARAFAALWAEGGFAGGHLSLAVSGQTTALRTLRLPQMRRRELVRAVALQAQEMLPVRLADLLHDWDVLPARATRRDGPRHLTVVVAAAERQPIELALTAAADAGLVVDSVSLAPLALRAALSVASVFDDQRRATATRAIVDVDRETSTIVTLRGGIPELTTATDVGCGRVLAETIAVMPSRISASGATTGGEAMDDEASISSAAPFPGALTWTRSEPAADTASGALAEGLAAALVDCEEAMGSRLADVTLCGRGALAPGLAASLARLLDVPASLYSAAPALPGGAVGLTDADLQRLSPRLAVALGLALDTERSADSR